MTQTADVTSAESSLSSAGVSAGADLVAFADLARREQKTPLPTPIKNEPGLPLSRLEPEVLERLVAEVVYRHDHRGVYLYGRRGQKQHGLDVVEARPDGGRTLYQVKRYQALSPKKMRDAVEEYAGAPRETGHGLPPRAFAADRFVVATSAALDADTANVDAVDALRREYAGDLDIDVWGAEALSRRLRDAPRLVHAVFGPDWAKEFCAFDPSPDGDNAPRPLGFVEDPVVVLGLAGLLADADEAAAPQAANLYRTVARALDSGGFPGHASVVRRQEAEAALKAGERPRAFAAAWPAAVRKVESGEHLLGRLDDLRAAAGDDNVAMARVGLLEHASDWREQGSRPAAADVLLARLVDARDPSLPLLAALTLEQALVDGLFDFDPPRSSFVDPDGTAPQALAGIVASARSASEHTPDPTLRARIDCAVADAGLRASSAAAAVEAAYGPLVGRASAGRYGDAHGLVASRAARAFAQHADPGRAEDLGRQAIMASSEAGLYGDARGALRAMTLLDGETGTFQWRSLAEAVQAMPNRRQLLVGAQDQMQYALAQAHAQKLPDALGHVRHALLSAFVSGHLLEEVVALDLLGDVVDAGGHGPEAVEFWVAAGKGKKAAARACGLGGPAHVEQWLRLPWRRRADAAAQAVGAQADVVPDGDVAGAAAALLDVCESLWTSPLTSPHPELSALKAVGAFEGRLSDDLVARLLTVCEPALTGPTRVGDDITTVLARIHAHQPDQRRRTGPALCRMLSLAPPPHNAWEAARDLEGAHELLLPTVVGLAENGSAQAVLTLAAWRHDTPYVQECARRACSALLRRPYGDKPDHGAVTTQDHNTVLLLRALLDAEAPRPFPPESFSAARAWDPGGVLMSVGIVVDDSDGPPEDVPAGPRPEPVQDTAADAIAEIAAGPPLDLALAVARHLLATAEARTDLALIRVSPVQALSNLLGELDPVDAAGMAPRLLALHRDPGLTETDLFEMRSDTPLSRYRFSGGAVDLAPAALLAAAYAVRRAIADGQPDGALRNLARGIVAAAVPLLASQRHATWAAGAVHTVAAADPGLSHATLLMAAHADERVRAIGAHVVPADTGLLDVLSADGSARVRRAVASRAGDASGGVVDRLLVDTAASVRRAAAPMSDG